MGPIILADADPSLAEAYRFARVRLGADPGGTLERRVVIITSINPGEGKSTTAINLAASLGKSDPPILLVDADLRRPRIHRGLGISMEPGLSNLIAEECGAAEAIRATKFEGVHVLPAGRPISDATEALGSTRMRDLLAWLRQRFGRVLLDTPPIAGVADALALCPLADGVVMVVAADVTSYVAIQRGLEQVESVGGKPIGVVLNKVDLKRNAYYYRHYYPGYYDIYQPDLVGSNRRRPALGGTAPAFEGSASVDLDPQVAHHRREPYRDARGMTPGRTGWRK